MNCALITGASKGIGRAIALQLSRDHRLHILINYSSDLPAAEETLATITAEGGSAELLKFNVENKQEVDSVISNWQQEHPDGFIRVLVNNAGIAKDTLFMWMSEKNWDDVIGISLKGMFNVTQNVIRQMLKNKTGRIINMSSVSGLKGVAGQTNYSAAKAGIIGATKSLAQEVAKMNITVNAVAPGFIDTAMLKGVDMEKYMKSIPAGRIGQPEEVAHLVSFLASEKSSYITGEVIHINGGLYS
ncbi:3-oxoacyl-ACP reductase FabG [Chitinophagaceae bacterium LB-8]|uniref:3-oxoacyl-ACP reductase FabG n=1 Tax=Paraflavisolibacter caeni TaxID=2982496 RepID=A0A9X3B935_9BACT|nr:3-oxoacyl-ACP reductase FabG [Paraflavisolibacter caeni]MCU7551600.1 3-oxoacyl-ACP reductase FabG [Paraflavisolibacter caeni]